MLSHAENQKNGMKKNLKIAWKGKRNRVTAPTSFLTEKDHLIYPAIGYAEGTRKGQAETFKEPAFLNGAKF